MYKDSEGEGYLSIDEARLYLDDDNAVKWLKQLFVHYKGRATAHFETDKILRCDLTKVPELELKLEEDSEGEKFTFNLEDIIASKSYVHLDAIQPIKRDLLRKFWLCEQKGGGFFINSLFKLHDGKVNGVDWTSYIEPYAKPYNKFYSDKGLLLKDNISFKLERVITKANICVKQSDLNALSELYGIPRKDELEINKTDTGKTLSIYEKRKISFEVWKATVPDLDKLTKKKIHENLLRHDKKEKLWDVKFSSFNRQFWGKYINEHPKLKRG